MASQYSSNAGWNSGVWYSATGRILGGGGDGDPGRLTSAVTDRQAAVSVGVMGEDTDDQERFAALYPRLRRLAAVAAPLEVEPDDLVQDALVAVLRRGPLADLDDPGAYLSRTIVNLAANSRRGLGRRRRAWARHGASSVDELPDYPSDLGDLDALAPAERALLYLVDVEGRAFDDAASVVGLSPGAARQRASRARRQLRLELGGSS